MALDALLENAVAHTDQATPSSSAPASKTGTANLAVADSGCGIPRSRAGADLRPVLPRAAPYRSREVGGFGLGLPTAAAIAEAHHGSVRVRSTGGKGSTFAMVIPVAPGAVIGSAPRTYRRPGPG